jgi:hypothetical protein
VALKYYPDLVELERKLSRLSWKLTNTYRAYLLESKAFEGRAGIAKSMEDKFFEAYFGANKDIVQFARTLIDNGERKAALAVNEAVRVLGTEVDPTRLIPTIVRDYGVWKSFVNLKEVESLLKRIDANPHDTDACIDLVKEFGGSGHKMYGVWSNNFWIKFQGEQHDFKREIELRHWVKLHLLGLARTTVGQ